MKVIKEVIDLPSVETKPLLHPLDVTPARRPYLVAWWLRRLASLPVAFLFGVVLWTLSNNVLTPFVVPLIVLVSAALAGEYYAGRAWEHIPRRRMDPHRDTAALPQLGTAFIDALALVSGLLLLIAWVSARSLPAGIEEAAIGAGAGIAVIQVAEALAALLRRRRHWVGFASKLVALAAMILTVLVAWTTLVANQWSGESIQLALIGGAAMIAIQLLLWLIRFVGPRRVPVDAADR